MESQPTASTTKKHFAPVARVAVLASPKRRLFDLEASTLLATALATLEREHLRSAPVYVPVPPQQQGSSGSTQGRKRYLGFVSTFDLVSRLAFASYFARSTKPSSSNPTSTTTITPEHLEFAEESLQSTLEKIFFKDHTASEAKEVLITFEPTTPLTELFKYFSSGYHQALVDYSAGDLRLVSQTDLVRYIANHPDAFADVRSQPIKAIAELATCYESSRLVTAPSNLTALEVFRLMKQHKVYAMPVVDETDGSLVTTISTADVKELVCNDTIDSALLPVLEYLRRQKYDGATCEGVIEPLSCQLDSTLDQVMQTLAKAKMHHHQIWIVDPETKKPIGVISLSDIIRVLHKATKAK